MDNQIYCGSYYMMGFLLDVREEQGELAVAISGVPEGFEIRLETMEDGRIRMHGGPMDGSWIEFVLGEDGEVTAARVGNFELARISTEKAASLPVVERLTAPPFALTPQKQAAFETLLDEILARPVGGKIEYALAYPKYEFVQFLTARDIFIFHGSNNREIEEFAPVRTSVELYDQKGSGNLQAVYGTHDGLWSMFFAVVNRKQLRGSIRNGVMYMHNRAGETLAVYNFSINQEQLAERPWTPGALYLLPRDSFQRQRMTEESFSNEWASTAPVKPVARLDLEPEDFPFLEQIGGHDDSVLIRSEELWKAVRAKALTASLEGAHLKINVPKSAEMAQKLSDLIEIQEVLIPAATFDVLEAPDELTLSIDHLPGAYQQVFGETYRDLLAK